MRCSLLRPKWRTTGRVWVTHRRTPPGGTRTVSSAATQIGVGPKRAAHSFRGSGPSLGADQRPATSATTGSMGGISFQVSNCPTSSPAKTNGTPRRPDPLPRRWRDILTEP